MRPLFTDCVCYYHVGSPWAAKVAQQRAEGQGIALMHLWIG